MMIEIILQLFFKKLYYFLPSTQTQALACYSCVTASCLVKDQKTELKSSTNLQQAEASQSKMILNQSNSSKWSKFNENKCIYSMLTGNGTHL